MYTTSYIYIYVSFIIIEYVLPVKKYHMKNESNL